VPTSVYEGGVVEIAWGESIDPQGFAVSYALERSVNSGGWTQIYSGSTRTYSDTAGNWNSIRYRVKAVAADLLESGYTTSDAIPVTHNAPPVISGTDRDLGTFTNSFTPTTYIVTDADDLDITATEKLDGVVLREYDVTLGATNTLGFSEADWIRIPDGQHTLTIDASDGFVTTRRTLTFTKSISALRVKMAQPISADDRPSIALVNIHGAFPGGSILTVEICNNGFDDAPTWETCTGQVLNGMRITITNTTKTADSWGVNVRATLERGSATAPCYITSIGGNFA
jgi:hypothetical protein